MPDLTRPAVPEVLGRLAPADVAEVHALVERATAADGTPMLLHPGQTWVELAPKDAALSVSR